MRAITIICFAALPALLVLPACGEKDDGAFESGCFDGDDDGYKDGYANGFSCAENRYESYDEFAAAIGDHPRPDCADDSCAYYEDWMTGYAECYAISYDEGLNEGARDGSCN